MKPRSGSYVIGLDHLRAIAALLVLCWHSLHYLVPYNHVPRFWGTSLIEEGWIGVSLFIAITGFIFTVITHNKDIHYWGFLKNRFLRLFPLIFLVTLYWASITEFNPEKPNPQANMLLFFNLLGGGSVYGTWTLAVEFQFYLVYPFLRDRLVSNSARDTLFRCAALMLLLFVLRLAAFYHLDTAQRLSYFSIFGQGDAFIAGILAGLAFLRLQKSPPNPALLWLVLIVGLTAVTAVTHWMNSLGGFYDNQGFPSESIFWVFWPTLIAIPCASLLAPYCLLMRHRAGVVSRAVAYLGTISYSTYMLHFIIAPLVYQILKTHVGLPDFASPMLNGLILVALIYPVTIAVSTISYELIERSFLKKRVPYLTDHPANIESGSAPIALRRATVSGSVA